MTRLLCTVLIALLTVRIPIATANQCDKNPREPACPEVNEFNMQLYIPPIYIPASCNSCYLPVANDGFDVPLVGYSYWDQDNTKSGGGYAYLELADYGDGFSIRHPGWDMNNPPGIGNGDRGKPVIAAARGRVVHVDKNKNMGTIAIVSRYKNHVYYHIYRHCQTIRVNVCDLVERGEQIAEIGKEGTNYAHLHFEIREIDHPNPPFGPFWCPGDSRDEAKVEEWYENPKLFIETHSAYRCAETGIELVDVACNHWAYNSLREMQCRGVFTLDSNGRIWPEKQITRGETATSLVRLTGLGWNSGPFSQSPFCDVPKTHSHYEGIAKLYDHGVVEGRDACSTGTPSGCAPGERPYCPDDDVTRAEFSKIQVRTVQAGGYDVPLTNCQRPPFTDISQSSHPTLCTFVATMKRQRWAMGLEDGRFLPDDTITRAQASRMMELFIDSINDYCYDYLHRKQ